MTRQPSKLCSHPTHTYSTSFHRQLTNIPLNWHKNGEQTQHLAVISPCDFYCSSLKMTGNIGLNMDTLAFLLLQWGTRI